MTSAADPGRFIGYTRDADIEVFCLPDGIYLSRHISKVVGKGTTPEMSVKACRRALEKANQI